MIPISGVALRVSAGMFLRSAGVLSLRSRGGLRFNLIAFALPIFAIGAEEHAVFVPAKAGAHAATPVPPTLGAKPPAGAIVLFDGSNLDAWATKSGKDWLKENGPAKWKLVEVEGRPFGELRAGRVMEVVPEADSLISLRKFGDLHLHAEFRTLGAPTNSGIYFQARYEVNINETFGRTDGTPNGGLDNCTDVKPSVRASRAPLEWQTLDIDFVAPRFDAGGKKTANARATVLLNGVKLYDRQELNPPKGAAGRLGEAATGPVMLQEHGMPVQFRNIWVVER
jgi:hypothetical protein